MKCFMCNHKAEAHKGKMELPTDPNNPIVFGEYYKCPHCKQCFLSSKQMVDIRQQLVLCEEPS